MKCFSGGAGCLFSPEIRIMFPPLHATKVLLIRLLCVLLALPTFAFATSPRPRRVETPAMTKPKLAPDLAELLVADDEAADRKKSGARTLAEARRQKLALRREGVSVILPSSEVAPDEQQSFIVQMNDTASSAAMKAKLAAFGGRVSHRLDGMGLVMVEAPRAVIRQLAADNSIAYVSPDRLVTSSGHIGNTTGWRNTGIWDKGDTNSSTWLVGGVGHIAIIDSGLDSSHSLLRWSGATGPAKVKYSKDFTGQNITGDAFGHGTHVASMLAGDSGLSSSAYRGVADGSNLLNLRVLDANGMGAASNVIAALDWCVTNKTSWNIRVINLSLGAMAKDSYVNDPLCLAARRAWNAGIVVVCAAGNDGKAANGSKIYGAIHSPGNDPAVITVGAANTFGTDARSDDVVASYSSRGPTRSYVTVNGVRRYDNLIKPDLIAPGNRLIGARASYNGGNNTLTTNYPSLQTGSSAVATDKVMYLSGTSMAAPIVAAAASLLVQTNQNLTPNLIKAILMYSAQPLAGANTFEQGAGLLNIDGAVRLARLVKTTLPTTNGAALLTAALPTSQTSVIAGQTVKWSQGVVTNYGFLYGSNLMTYWQSIYGNGVMLADATSVAGGLLTQVSGRTYSVSLKNGAVRIDSSGAVLSDGVIVADGVMLADGVIIADGVMLADGAVLSDGVILSDGQTRADTTLQSTSAFLGDNTAGMPPAP
jgi:subtilisin family serine protease